MRKLGILARMDDSGLGNQTKRLVDFLKPEKVLVIDSTPFGKNKVQHRDWYKDYNAFGIKGFPTNNDVEIFGKDLTHFFCCENPHNFHFYVYGKRKNYKTYCQTNYEFCDNLNRLVPLPDKFIMPSYWYLEDMQHRFGNDRVLYLPPPLDLSKFDSETNKARSYRFLHIVGTLAEHDRNGTLDLLSIIKYIPYDFKLVVRSQHQLPSEYIIKDERIVYEIGNVQNPADMYKGFDALILPRRYGGLCLTCNEALASGLPVIMPDISPNNRLLKKNWLVDAKKVNTFMARVSIDVCSVDDMLLVDRISEFITMKNEQLLKEKQDALQIAKDNFSEEVLFPKYAELWK